jgi:predicted nucleic acid-binding protein
LADAKSPFHTQVMKAFTSLEDEDTLSLSILSLYEIEYGFSHGDKAQLAEKIRRTRQEFLAVIELLPLTQRGAETFGKLKATYRRWLLEEKKLKNKVLSKTLDFHNVDFIIASSALEQEAVLVSNDTIFLTLEKIYPDLKVENWANARI